MTSYRDLSGRSGIVGYVILKDAILIAFERGGVYQYDAEEIGQGFLDEVVSRATAGSNLNTYINQNPQVKAGGVKLG